MPNLIEIAAATGQLQSVNYQPSVSIIDDNNQSPTTQDEMFAFSNKVCHWKHGRDIHDRGIYNAQKLLTQVENKEYFDTNGSWVSREQIPTAAQVAFRVVHPSPQSDIDDFGFFKITYWIAFSSRNEVTTTNEMPECADP